MKSTFVVPAKLGLAGAAVLCALLVGCSDPKSGAGFRLPDGEVSAGREAFVRLNCQLCHTVSGE